MISEKTSKKLSELRKQGKIAVLFVCLGNICRSPAAEGVFKQIIKEHHDEKRWVIDSAGTGGFHVGDMPDRRMRVHASRRGLTLDHICRKIKYSDFDDFDLIIAMDSSNEEDLKAIAPTAEAEEKIVMMSEFFTLATRFDYVPDPYYEGAEGFELVLDLLQDACATLYRELSV